MTFMEPAQEQLDRILDAVRTTGQDAGGDDADGERLLDALVALHELRAQLLAWEPELIRAARDRGVSWARLAPALGVTSRQAAERRFLRLSPGSDAGLTREERVQAARDERAGDRAVAAWARANASELRQIAGRASAVRGLGAPARRRARALATSLTDDDPASLLDPLADLHADLVEGHERLAEEISAVGRRVERVRSETQRRRTPPDRR